MNGSNFILFVVGATAEENKMRKKPKNYLTENYINSNSKYK